MAHLAEGLGKVVCGIAVVFDDQQTHEKMALVRICVLPGRRIGLRGTDHSGHGIDPSSCIARSNAATSLEAKGRRLEPPPLTLLGADGGDESRRRAGQIGFNLPPRSTDRGGMICFVYPRPSRSATNLLPS